MKQLRFRFRSLAAGVSALRWIHPRHSATKRKQAFVCTSLAGVVFATFTCVGSLSATPRSKKVEAGILLGGAFPVGTLAQKNNASFAGAVDVGYWFNQWFQAAMDIGYNFSHGTKIAGTTGQLRILQFGVRVKLSPFKGRFLPYLEGGVGGYHLRQSLTVDGETATSAFNTGGFNMGGGIDCALGNRAMLAIGMKWHKAINFFLDGRGAGWIMPFASLNVLF